MTESPDRLETPAPKRWIERFLPYCPAESGGWMLDLAAGTGRHTVLGNRRGWRVCAVDRSIDKLAAPASDRVEKVRLDLESTAADDVAGILRGHGPFSVIIVTNYLYRPLLPYLPGLLSEDGLLLYETFMSGNEQYGRPSNPEFLLKQDELFQQFSPILAVAAFEQGFDPDPSPRMIQRVCCFNGPLTPAGAKDRDRMR